MKAVKQCSIMLGLRVLLEAQGVGMRRTARFVAFLEHSMELRILRMKAMRRHYVSDGWESVDVEHIVSEPQW